MSDAGFSVSDILEADHATLFAILSAQSEKKENDDFMSLEDFLKANPNL